MKKLLFLVVFGSLFYAQAGSSCASCNAMASTQVVSQAVLPTVIPKTQFDKVVQMLPIEACTCKADQQNMMRCTCPLKTQTGVTVFLSGSYDPKIGNDPKLQVTIDSSIVGFNK